MQAGKVKKKAVGETPTAGKRENLCENRLNRNKGNVELGDFAFEDSHVVEGLGLIAGSFGRDGIAAGVEGQETVFAGFACESNFWTREIGNCKLYFIYRSVVDAVFDKAANGDMANANIVLRAPALVVLVESWVRKAL